MKKLYPLLRGILFQLDPEKTHHLTLWLLRLVMCPAFVRRIIRKFPQKPVTVFGISFPNPVGLAAGFDNNADYLDALFGLGFGFVEVGAVTPKAQAGNSKPRLYRLLEADALINRMGFPNLGVDHLLENLKRRRVPGIVGVNIGKNRETPLSEAVKDYQYCLEKVYPYVDYVTINISSPNTPELRKLQTPEYLEDLLKIVVKQRDALSQQHARRLPLLVKVAPDLTISELEVMVKTFMDCKIDGIIATNTWVDHSSVSHLRYAQEQGGLSGKPLFEHATSMIKEIARLTEGRLPLVALGGIHSPEEAAMKFEAGASLVQLYTGLIYQGPGLVRDIVESI